MFSFGVQRGIKNSVLLLTVLLVVCLVGILVAAFYLDRSLSQDVSEIQNAVDHRQAANIQALMVSARKVFLIITLLSISAVGFVVWGSGVLWTSHIRPLQSMVNVLGRVSNGDFEQQIQIDGSKEIQGLAQGFNHVIERAKSSLKLSGRLAGGESFEDIFDSIYDSFHRYLPYERMGIALIDHATQTIRAERAQSEVPVHLEVGYSLPLGQTSLRRVIESGVPRIIGDLELYAEKHPDSEATQLMLKEGIRSSMTMPLNINNRPMGALFFSSTSKYAYKEHHVQFLQVAAGSITGALEKAIMVGDVILAATMGFTNLAGFRDVETGEHLQRMRRYARVLAKKLAQNPLYSEVIDEAFIHNIYTFSPLHDIGKIGIPDSILLKPGKLTEAEFAVMKQHTIIGAQALEEAEAEALRLDYSIFSMAIEIAAYHHERYDGTGYPSGLAGDAIPVAAKITSIADVFDALTSERPYKRAFSFEEAIEMVLEGRGTQFDPGVVEAFEASIEEFRSIYLAFQEPATESEHKQTIRS